MSQPPTASEHHRGLAWGLDLSQPDVTTPEEIDTFRRISESQLGMQQDGLDFWLDTRPDVLKRYRSWAQQLRVRAPGEHPSLLNANGPAILITYALLGFEDGLRYGVHGLSRNFTRAEAFDILALAFRYVGPRGMAAIAKAAKGHEWTEPTAPVVWPEGWAYDPDALHSGVDFRTPGASAEDVRKIEAWYDRVLGEVPTHIRFLGRYRPELLKAYRDRYENTLRVLPKQIEPYVQIQLAVQRHSTSIIREGVLLARGFGMPKEQVLEAMSWGTFYGGTEALDFAHEAADDLLAGWL